MEFKGIFLGRREPRLLPMPFWHPVRHYIPRMERKKIWSSIETGVIRASGKRIAVAKAHYWQSKFAEKLGIEFPVVSVAGVTRFRDKVLVGLRSSRVRFPLTLCPAPAGHVDWLEKPSEAIERELEEELGVKASSITFIGIAFSSLFLAFAYEIEIESKEVKKSWEYERLYWVKLSELLDFLRRNRSRFGPKIHLAFYTLYLAWLGKEFEIKPRPIEELAYRWFYKAPEKSLA